MNVELQINNSSNSQARYLSWAPSACRIRVSNPEGAPSAVVTIRLTATSAAGAGAVLFRRATTGPFTSSLGLRVPVTGLSVRFFVAGRFGRPSTSDQDVTIEASAAGTVVGSVTLMVRVRKNANNLTDGERDRLIAAFTAQQPGCRTVR